MLKIRITFARHCHAWTIGVEDTNHLRTNLVQTVVVEEQCLSHALAFVVAGTQTDGVHIAPVGLWLWMNVRVAIHLAG